MCCKSERRFSPTFLPYPPLSSPISRHRELSLHAMSADMCCEHNMFYHVHCTCTCTCIYMHVYFVGSDWGCNTHVHVPMVLLQDLKHFLYQVCDTDHRSRTEVYPISQWEGERDSFCCQTCARLLKREPPHGVLAGQVNPSCFQPPFGL